MRLALNIGYAGAEVRDHTKLVQEAERLGYHSVWAAEAYGSDVVTPLAWYAARTERIAVGTAIMQMQARTPATTAMTAVTLSELSGGRFLLGLGVSGPQVVEGWHGRPYGKPLALTREYVGIVRRALAREERLTHAGDHFDIPYAGADATGLGKPLRLIVHPTCDVPVYLAAIGPKNVALTAEIADGWLPAFYSPDHAADVWGPHLAAGLARADDPAKELDVVVAAPVAITDAPDQARWAVRPALALYIGGMGARGRNFYFDLACRYGFEQAATEVQDHYLAGRKQQAMAAVPDELVDATSVIGPPGAVSERLDAYREAGVTTLAAMTEDPATLRQLAELAA